MPRSAWPDLQLTQMSKSKQMGRHTLVNVVLAIARLAALGLSALLVTRHAGSGLLDEIHDDLFDG